MKTTEKHEILDVLKKVSGNLHQIILKTDSDSFWKIQETMDIISELRNDIMSNKYTDNIPHSYYRKELTKRVTKLQEMLQEWKNGRDR